MSIYNFLATTIVCQIKIIQEQTRHVYSITEQSVRLIIEISRKTCVIMNDKNQSNEIARGADIEVIT